MTAPRVIKKCNSCGEHKDRGEFPKARSMKCSECHVSRVCVRCGERKSVEHFPLAGGSKHHGTTNRIRRCHPCLLADKRGRYAQFSKGQSFLYRYGITLEQRDEMLAAQGGVCDVCKSPDPGGRGEWCTDHDHSCCPGKSRSCGQCIRGILCFGCNVMLGCAKDSQSTLANAIEYLRKSK